MDDNQNSGNESTSDRDQPPGDTEPEPGSVLWRKVKGAASVGLAIGAVVGIALGMRDRQQVKKAVLEEQIFDGLDAPAGGGRWDPQTLRGTPGKAENGGLVGRRTGLQAPRADGSGNVQAHWNGQYDNWRNQQQH